MGKNDTLKALDKFSAKHAKELEPKKKRTKRNSKPEKKSEKEVVKWAKKMGLYLYKTDAAAIYNSKTGRYIPNPDLEAGHSDYSGNTPLGVASYIEVKAKGSRANVSLKQHMFLTSKIRQGCFAVVVDSDEILDLYYRNWLEIVNSDGLEKGKNYLLHLLPKKKFANFIMDDL